MKGFENITHVYFIGIGGIGMSALARLFNHHKLEVAGYDKTPSALTSRLQKEGIKVHYEDFGDSVSSLAGPVDQTLIVVTPAVPENHGELQWFIKNNFRIWKRSRLLGHICRQYSCLAVGGTHGKTTVSTMAAVILNQTPSGCGAILGGISKNFETNLIIPLSDEQWMVTEADEFDRSFLQLDPDIAVITSMDADHLDVYGKHEEFIASFKEFARKVRPGGKLLIKKPLMGFFPGNGQAGIYTYALSGNADFTAESLRLDENSRNYVFRLSTPEGLSPEIRMTYPGLLNVENAVAAGAAAFLAGAGLNDICNGLSIYSGVKRRFDILFRTDETVYIDDYAHHPEELRAFITSVRALYPGRHITGIFQPHLYTRTRDFANEFAKSLDLLDTAVLIPVYPARELPIPGIDSRMLLEKMSIESKYAISKEDVPQFLKTHPSQVLLTMGAGDIELLSGVIIQILKDEAED
jgi:UDP-N-acetylmuramate--alanine ligase